MNDNRVICVPDKEHGKPLEIDIHIGAKLRFFRTMAGYSQPQLSKELKITFQQLQKYEKGENRISAGLLYYISLILKVPVTAFYEGFGKAEWQAFQDSPFHLQSSSLLKVARAINHIPNPKMQAIAVAACMSVLSAFQE